MTAPWKVEDRLADILARLRPGVAYPHSLLESLGLAAAADVISPQDMPARSVARVSGYAVRAIDTQGATSASPVALRSVAGQAAVVAGTCLPVEAGAALPSGADAVVGIEDTIPASGQVHLSEPLFTGASVSVAAGVVARGTVMVKQGELVGAREIGLLAGLGFETVAATPRPRVVVISLGTGTAAAANSYLAAATVRDSGAIAYRVPAHAVDATAFAEVLDDQLVRADLVVITGGADREVRNALAKVVDIGFDTVATHPISTLGFGLVGHERTPTFVLPCEPVAAYVAYCTFVAPALRYVAGRTPLERPLFRAKSTTGIYSVVGRRHLLPGAFTSGPAGAQVRPLEGLHGANALIVLRESEGSVQAGDPVPIMLLDREF